MIHLVERGDPAHPGLVFFHGFLGSHRDFLEIAEGLAEDFHVMLPDLPGHGKTPPPNDNPFEPPHVFLNELAALLSEKHRSYRCLVGYSMGGRLAQAFVLRFPKLFSALVLESTSPGIEDPEERLSRKRADQKLAERMRTIPFKDFLGEWYAQSLFSDLASDPKRLSETIAMRMKDATPSHLAAALERLGPGDQPSYWGALPSFTQPTLLIVGERDTKYLEVMRRMKNLLPDSKLEVMADAGHNTHLKNPSRFSELLRELIEPLKKP